MPLQDLTGAHGRTGAEDETGPHDPTGPHRRSALVGEIIAVIASLSPGEVVSYGDVAHDAGHPGAARAVGALLASTDVELPWWRVVRGDGRLVTADPRRQAALLRAEGVTVTNNRVTSAPHGRFTRR